MFGALLDSLTDSFVSIVFAPSPNYTATASLLVGRMIAITDAGHSIRRIIPPQRILPSAAGYPIRMILRPMGIVALSAGIRTVEYPARRYPPPSGGYPIRRISPPAVNPTISGRYPFHRAVRPLGLSQ